MYDRNIYEIDHRLDADTRVGDADREATAERLRRHHTEGRLDIDEFQERLDRCYQATTAGQLHLLVADLPRDAQRASRHYSHQRLVRLVPILVAILVVTAVTGGGHGFLFLFLLFPLARFFLWPRRSWIIRGPRAGAGGQL